MTSEGDQSVSVLLCYWLLFDCNLIILEPWSEPRPKVLEYNNCRFMLALPQATIPAQPLSISLRLRLVQPSRWRAGWKGTQPKWKFYIDLSKVESLQKTTVDGKNSCTSWYGKYPSIYRGFIHPRWCSISSINSMFFDLCRLSICCYLMLTGSLHGEHADRWGMLPSLLPFTSRRTMQSLRKSWWHEGALPIEKWENDWKMITLRTPGGVIKKAGIS